MAQSFWSANSSQRHEAENQEYVQGAIKTARKLQMLAQAAEQTIGPLCGQGGQKTCHWNIAHCLETGRAAFEQSNRSSYPLNGACARRTHPASGIGINAAMFRL
jgi:hypothetical protein